MRKQKTANPIFGSAAFLYISSVISADRADAVRAVGRVDVQLGLLVLVAAEQRRVEGAHRSLAALVLRTLLCGPFSEVVLASNQDDD